MSVTIYDVARHAGVSPRTVSNVINDYPFVAAHTRQRVQDSIQVLGYRPNLTARNLRRGRTGMIALAVPELAVPYFSELSGAVMEEVAEALVHDDHRADGRRPGTGAQAPRGQRAGAAVRRAHLQPARRLAPGTSARPRDGTRRSCCSASGSTKAPSTMSRSTTSPRPARWWRTSPGSAGSGSPPSATSPTRPARPRSSAPRATSRGLRSPACRRTGGSSSPPGGSTARRARRRCASSCELRNPPDAVFCYNDLLAAGAIRVLLTAGLRVPQDVAVAGFDDIEEGRYSTPTLTSLAPDKRSIAAMAVEQLFRRLEGGAGDPQVLQAPFSLRPGKARSAGPRKPGPTRRGQY